ncbi:MAG: biotin--[acetyl-CoA-carboxylase] ligase [Flavobacteriaceae bacterium]
MLYFKISKIDTIDSTNLALKRKYHKGLAKHGDVLWALDQVKGKGQRDSQWVSEPNKNLTFSIFLSQEKLMLRSVFVLNCWVALAVKNSLTSLNIPSVSIKWPNDILSENKKLCGILIENLYQGEKHIASIVGIGLNVNQINFFDLTKASSMQLSAGRMFDLEKVLQEILYQLSHYLETKMSPLDSLEAFNKALYGLGEERTFLENDKPFQATVEEVNAQGELVLKTAQNQLRCFQHKTIEWIY